MPLGVDFSNLHMFQVQCFCGSEDTVVNNIFGSACQLLVV